MLSLHFTMSGRRCSICYHRDALSDSMKSVMPRPHSAVVAPDMMRTYGWLAGPYLSGIVGHCTRLLSTAIVPKQSRGQRVQYTVREPRHLSASILAVASWVRRWRIGQSSEAIPQRPMECLPFHARVPPWLHRRVRSVTVNFSRSVVYFRPAAFQRLLWGSGACRSRSDRTEHWELQLRAAQSCANMSGPETATTTRTFRVQK
jgi:hypothetical protein